MNLLRLEAERQEGGHMRIDFEGTLKRGKDGGGRQTLGEEAK